MPLKNWSTLDAENDDADISSNILWTEGQAPSTINNSARAVMTQIRRFFDEIRGGTVAVPASRVGGTADAITLTTDQTPAYIAGQRLVFVAQSDNTGPVTIDKDGQGARAVNSHGAALAGGAIRTGDVVLIMDDGTDYELVYPRRTLPDAVDLCSDDGGDTEGPVFTLYRNSADPADGDSGGTVNFAFNNSAGGKVSGVQLLAELIEPGDGSEDFAMAFHALRAGSKAAQFRVGAGLYTPNAVGGDKGEDTINASGVHDDGLRLRGTPVAVLQDRKPLNVDGGTFSSGADRTRTLNTILSSPYSLVSLSLNRFTLPAGNWVIRWSAPAARSMRHQSLLYDVTGAAEVARGTSEFAEFESANENEPCHIQTRSFGIARVTPTASNAYEIRHRCQRTQGTNGLGTSSDFGTEIYTVVEIYAG